MDTHFNTENLIKDIRKLAAEKNVVLDDEQLHVGGERVVMSPNKFVFTGSDKNTSERVVFKCAKHKDGVQEMQMEHKIRTGLENMPFAQQKILLPTELFSGFIGNWLVTITKFIDQEKVFANHPLTKQFFMALQGLETQESFHATTRENRKIVQDLFTSTSPNEYVAHFQNFKKNVRSIKPEYETVLNDAESFLSSHIDTLKTFDGYLMHTDFVPHNFRIKDGQLILLDYSSFEFGNKYESWARFVNYMEIHNPKLVPLLLKYVEVDRGKEEYLDLKLMRIYKIGFLLNFYTRSFIKTEGDLHKLADARLTFWSMVLKSVVNDAEVDPKKRVTYITTRDALRSEKEKKRQREFNVA